MSDSSPFHFEHLLDNATWIRSLASQLVSNDSDRDDLVQETYARALEKPPGDLSGLRGWLATVMRNVASQNRRGDGRRRVREEVSALDEALEPASELVQRVALQRELARKVLELDEPYRTALLLRYFEGLPPREISRKLKVPVATVHSRLKRALTQLRERLDESHAGDRATWVSLFLPIAAPPPPAAVTTLGVLLVNTKLALVLLAVLVAGTLVTMVDLPERTFASDEIETPIASVIEPATTVERESLPIAPLVPEYPSRQEVLPTPDPTADREVAEATPKTDSTRLVSGQVLDASGSPLSGFPVRIEGKTAAVVSGIDGRFELESTTDQCRIVAASPKWVTVREGYYRVGSFDPVLVVSPAIHLAGEVVSSNGQPLANAKVGFELPEGFDTRFTKILDSTHIKSWRAMTDSRGKFELLDIPGVADSRLTVALAGYQLEQAPAPAQTDRALHFILKRPSKPIEGSLSGRVLDPNGEPVERARVAAGLTATLTDEDGLFHLDLHRAVTPDRVAAVKAGYLPANLERPYSSTVANGGWPDFVELELGGPPLTLKGRVVDAEGEPVRGSRVWLKNTTRFGTIGIMPTSFENLMDGANVPPETVEAERMLPDTDGESMWKSTVGGAPSNAAWHWKLTDSEGHFEFGGLYDRSYRVNVLDMDSLVSFTSEDLQPGAEVALIELPEAELFEELQGVVVNQSGAPMKGVRVTLRADPYDESSRVFGGTTQLIMTINREQTSTDDQGRFHFERVPRHGIRLTFESDEIVPTVRSLSEFEANPTAIEIEVDARCHVSIELETPGMADRFEFEDADGGHLSVHVISETSHSSSTSGDFVNGRSGVVSVSGRATQLVLMLGNAEVERLPLTLFPGELNEIRH